MQVNKHLIICIHGMGNIGENWGKENVETPLETAYNSYPELLNRGAFSDRFEFKFIDYNAFFEANLRRKRDKQIALANLSPQAESIVAGFGGVAESIVNMHKLDLSGDNFWVTHFGDVFLYLLDDHVRGQVNAHLQKEIISAMTDFYAETSGHGNISVIAHSLGTSAITTALQQLYTDDTSILHKFGKLKTLMTVANVANLTSIVTGENVYDNDVFPHASRFKGVCYHYINSWHELDPFTAIKRFRPDQEQWNRTGGDSYLNGHIYIERPIEARHIRQLNAHSLTHYLSHPNVHLALFEYLEEDPSMGPVVSDRAYQSAIEAWQEKSFWQQLLSKIDSASNTLKPQLIDIRNQLSGLISNNDSDDLVEDLKNILNDINTLSDSASNELKLLKEELLKTVRYFQENR